MTLKPELQKKLGCLCYVELPTIGTIRLDVASMICTEWIKYRVVTES